jgi:hypothetical protein
MKVEFIDVPKHFVDTYRLQIMSWVDNPNSTPVMGFETGFGPLDLIKVHLEDRVQIAPEREVDEHVLRNFRGYDY